MPTAYRGYLNLARNDQASPADSIRSCAGFCGLATAATARLLFFFTSDYDYFDDTDYPATTFNVRGKATTGLSWEVDVDKFHIDILAANFVLHPDWFDVVVASNLFGDILSDLGPACTGTIGIAPSGNINPERRFPSLFEPVHGSASDIAGKGIANPVGQIWSAAMMLEHLGEHEAGAAVQSGFEGVLAERDMSVLTPDLGGTGTTGQLGGAIAGRITSDALSAAR